MRMGIAAILALLVISPVITIGGGQESNQTPIGCQLSFDGELANESVQYQTSLGPRLPGSTASSTLRESIKSNLTGWTITETTHHVDEMVLTNLFATWNQGAGSTVYFAAHYDTRDRAEKDWNVSRRDEPILGANDGASGVAVLIELARQIPAMNLTHEVTLFFTDGEDQGLFPSFLGAKSWSENISQTDANNIESFILVDMVGDSYLTLGRTVPSDNMLWNRTVDKIQFLDEVCELGDSTYFDNNLSDSIYDDHIYPLNLGIPSIDIIDSRYGEGVGVLGGHWHTHNDTADKISADSLQKVGYILESGLLTGSWLDVRVIEETEHLDTDGDGVSDLLDNCPNVWGDDVNGCQMDSSDDAKDSQDRDDLIIGVLLLACIILVWSNLAWLVFADNRGEG